MIDPVALTNLKAVLDVAQNLDDEAVEQAILDAAEQVRRHQQNRTQCASVSRGDDPVRCELVPGHGPYTRRYYSFYKGEYVTEPKPWKHAAPEHGTFWNYD